MFTVDCICQHSYLFEVARNAAKSQPAAYYYLHFTK